MNQTRKCPTKGCPGRQEFTTTGYGGTIAHCECCDKREAWALRHLPKLTAITCEICTGRFMVQARGAGRAKHCPVCRPLALQTSKNASGRKARQVPA